MVDLLKAKVDEWLRWDRNADTRNQIKRLSDSGDEETLRDLLLNRIHYGTAGIRGKLGAGYNQLNDLVVIQISQGVCMYAEDQFGKTGVSSGIVIGYDGRHKSQRFAELAAAVFIIRGFRVYLFSEMVPGSFISFSILSLQCVCGLMLSASHNPKTDNGVKIYWYNGSQIIPPTDSHIHQMMIRNQIPWPRAWDTFIVYDSPRKIDPLHDVERQFYSVISDSTTYPSVNSKCKLTFTYTPLHGVGSHYMKKAFEAAQLKPYLPVKSQIENDPNFPTVHLPNPEEGKKVYHHAFQTANKGKSTVVLANDPDANRLGVAEKQANGEWYVFTGNEVGALLGWWALHCFKQKNSNIPMDHVYMLSSSVSSKILQSMARVEGFNFEETLTGFKWITNRAWQLLQKDRNVIYAFEESCGYMYGSAILDKCGIMAGVQVAQLAAFLDKEKKTLSMKLHEIYKKYGHHLAINSYYFCNNPDTINELFTTMASWKGKPKTYPESVLKGKFKISSVRDIGMSYDSGEPDQVPRLPTDPSWHMVTFTFKNGMVVTFRSSGTEPKIKYYAEMIVPGDEKNTEHHMNNLKDALRACIEEFLHPSASRLIPPATE